MIYAKYIGGGFIPGIPAEDLTRDAFEALTPELQKVIRQSKLYQIVKPAKVADKEQE